MRLRVKNFFLIFAIFLMSYKFLPGPDWEPKPALSRRTAGPRGVERVGGWWKPLCRFCC